MLRLRNEENNQRLLEEKKLHLASLANFESKLLPSDNNKTEIQTLNNKYPASQGKQNEYIEKINSIKVEKYEDENIQNVEVYKQRNIVREEEQRIAREKAKIKKFKKEKYQYLAHNVYNNTNSEGILYERDMDLQRSFRFAKKELKSNNKLI